MLEVQDLLNIYVGKCKDMGCEVQPIEGGGYLISKERNEISISMKDEKAEDEMQLNFYKSESTSDDFVIEMMNMFADVLNSHQVK